MHLRKKYLRGITRLLNFTVLKTTKIKTMKARYFASDFPKSTPTAHWDATFCNGTRTADVDVFKAKDAEEWHAFIHENGVLQENCLVYVYETKPSLEKIKADYMKKDFN